MEASEYGMVVQKSRNNSQILLKMYHPFNNIVVQQQNCYQTSEQFVLPLPCKQPVVLLPGSTKMTSHTTALLNIG